MTRAGLRQARLLIDRLQTHQPQQACDSFVIGLMALRLKPGGHFTDAIERRARVLFIEQSHEQQVLFAFGLRLIIEAWARQSDQFALSRQTQALVRRLDQQALLIN